MTITAEKFRHDFPEFTDASIYTQSQICFWLSVSEKLVQECRWRDLVNHGRALFIAHHLVLQQRDIKAAATGGTPGDKTGVIASKAVDKVSVGYDNASTLNPNAGFWNLTTYGLQFNRLARVAGIGGMQASGSGRIVPPGLGIWNAGWPVA